MRSEKKKNKRQTKNKRTVLPAGYIELSRGICFFFVLFPISCGVKRDDPAAKLSPCRECWPGRERLVAHAIFIVCRKATVKI